MSGKAYRPPYTVSDKAVALVGDISAAIERFKIAMEGPDGVRLRKINRVKTIRGTTAIEGNMLTEEQITAVLAGRRVAAPAREIAEVRGAHAAYELLGEIDPCSLQDILRVHKAMMQGLVEGAGSLRTRGVGVVDGLGNVIHMAPPAGRVPELVADLLGWARTSEAHPLIKSCVFHYEFEFIHPFLDGNGRMGRFLQTAMLGAWNPLFHAAPIENMVYAEQAGYYEAIGTSTGRADSGPFIDFILGRILATIREKGAPVEAGQSGWETVEKTNLKTSLKTNLKSEGRILAAMKARPDVTVPELAEATGLSLAGVKWNIRKLKAAGRLRRVGPDKGGHWEVAGEEMA